MGLFDFLGGGGGDDPSAELRRQEQERQARIREGTNAISRVFGGKVVRQDPIFEMRPRAVPGQSNTGGARPMYSLDPRATQPMQSPTIEYDRVQTGTTPVTEEVDGQFTDDYFQNLEREYNDYYLPQLNRQEGDADRATRIKLARSGNLTGSVGARELGRLEEDKVSARRSVIDSGIKYGADARKRIEDTRGNLIGQLEAGAGIENVAGQARATADAATAPAPFSPLGDLFKNYTAAVMNSTVAAGNPAAFPGAEQQRRGLLFNIPKPGGSSGSATTVN